MKITKKDRIAIVLTVICLLFGVIGLLTDVALGVMWLSFAIAYWGYRFIRNDISFFKVDGD